jgi:uncharacterized protein (DUF1330 family)
MAAYVIVDLEVTDSEGFREYQKRAGSTIEHYGGKYLVRGGNHETLEGDWHLCWLLAASAEKMEGLISSVAPTLMPLVRMKQGQGIAGLHP